MSKTRTLAGLVSNGNPLADGTISPSEIGAATSSDILRISGVTYPGDDLAVNPAGGQTVTISGSGFTSTPTIYVGGTIAPSVTFVSATQLTFTTPVKTAGTYDIYVVNPNGATAIRVYGISYSGVPTWSTAAGSLGTLESNWTVQLQATSNSAVVYTLTSGSTLPTGVTLNSSGLITGTNVTTEQTFNFSVTATDAENQDTSRSFSISISLNDLYFNYTTLLLSGDGTNGAQNNTFLDSSSNAFTVTRSGNVTQGSFSPYGSNWSNYFDGSTNFFSTTQSSNFTFDANFTIEFWVYITVNIYGDIVGTANNSQYIGSGNSGWVIASQTSSGIRFAYQSSNTWVFDTTIGMTPTVNAWNHIAVVRSGSTITGYLNGVAGTTPITSGATLTSNLYGVYVGSGAGNQNLKTGGYISNLRIVKGTAVYTSNFTPSTTPLTAISGTSLLTCQSNRFIDNSTNAFAITVTGTPSVQRFNPFGTATAYSTSVIGGSGYFDGSGDRVYTPTTSALNITGDFTLECWVYRTAEGSSYPMVMVCSEGSVSAEAGIIFNYPGAGINFTCSGFGGLSGGNISFNEWNHVAVTRSSDTTRIFVNGIQKASTATGYTFPTGYPWYLGDRPAGASGANYPFAGYISDARMIKGQAIYTANFTPPTAPLTAVTNTQLLINFTNAAIVDNAMMNDLETVGNAQISTSVIKYGTGSLYFDGTGDYLVSAPSPNNILGGGDFTIEFWLYPSNTSGGYRALVASENYSAIAGGWSLYQNGGTSIEFWISSGNIINATSAITAGVWQHLALSRAFGTLRLFINGTQVTSVSNSTSLTGQQIWIGDNNSGSYFYEGYLDDLRITKGYARYTANFTPPTAAFKAR
jgi:hypothetical protein